MKHLPLLPVPSSRVRDALRDYVSDELRSRTRRQLIAEWTAGLANHRAERDPFLRRRKWALAQIHPKAELRAIMHEVLEGLGPLSSPEEPDPISGREITWHEASFLEAIGGINYVGAVGAGMATLAPEDIDWGDMIGAADFPTEDDAQAFSDALEAHGIPTSGPYLGSDGNWHVSFVMPESD